MNTRSSLMPVNPKNILYSRARVSFIRSRHQDLFYQAMLSQDLLYPAMNDQALLNQAMLWQDIMT